MSDELPGPPEITGMQVQPPLLAYAHPESAPPPQGLNGWLALPMAGL